MTSSRSKPRNEHTFNEIQVVADSFEVTLAQMRIAAMAARDVIQSGDTLGFDTDMKHEDFAKEIDAIELQVVAAINEIREKFFHDLRFAVATLGAFAAVLPLISPRLVQLLLLNSDARKVAILSIVLVAAAKLWELTDAINKANHLRDVHFSIEGISEGLIHRNITGSPDGPATINIRENATEAGRIGPPATDHLTRLKTGENPIEIAKQLIRNRPPTE